MNARTATPHHGPATTMPPSPTHHDAAPNSEVIQIRVERRARWKRAITRVWETLRALPARRSIRHLGKGVRLAPPIEVYGGGGISIEDNVAIWPHARVIAHNVGTAGDSEPIKLEIGSGTSIFPYAHFSAALSIRIGKRVMIASGAYISDHDHDIRDPNDPARLNGRVIASPVEIGDDVWLGERVCVLRGVSIGEGSIIGAASVVTRSIPARCIAVGAPARVIQKWDEATRTWAPVASP
jgi:acetyltransferase-like isoleucine patch superfamily enzyme